MRFTVTMALGLATLATFASGQVVIESDQYKRIHLQALRPLVDGFADEAVAALRAYDAEHPGDPETHYALTAALAQAGRIEEALAAVERAVELGLPQDRFAAGPREWFAPLQELPAFERFLIEAVPRLIHGPMLGAVTDRSASVWFRTRSASECTVRYRREPDGSAWQETDIAATSAATDYTAVVTLTGLTPNAVYRYELVVDGEAVEAPVKHTFQTMPERGEPAQFRVAFGGGAGYVPQHEYVWNTIRDEQPLALLLLGDNVYIDDPERSAIQRYCYYRRQSRPEWRALSERVPVFAVWDDHDFSTNDSLGGPAIDEPAWKRPVWRTFRRNWANPAYGGGTSQPGCWFHFAIGDVDFFMLDSRYYRTDPAGPNPSLLGPVQKQWLLDQLVWSTATFKMIVTPVPLVEGTKGDSDDTWDGYPEERESILDFIRTQEIEGVVVLSADRHRSDVWRIDRPGLYPMYEFESSRLTNQHVHKEMDAALFSYNDTQSFGRLDFDTAAESPSVTYTIMTIDGEAVHRHTFTADELRF